ncbi:ATP-binding protein [Streptomyces sp. NPDC059070]|uniref:ATP-binding protein n=1 Tax=unclassified Streptomyces TaxID=2593676 RepID=UPI0034E2FB7F
MASVEATGQASRSRRFSLDGQPGVVARCRDLTRQALDEWYSPYGPGGRAAAEDALLLVSEVVTNAYTHGDAPYELRLDHRGATVWVQVSDHSPRRPRPHGRHRAARSSGHGLYLLQRLSASWGWVPRGRGKTVWFEIEVAASPSA